MKFDQDKVRAAIMEQADALALQAEALSQGKIEDAVLLMHAARIKDNALTLQSWAMILIQQQNPTKD